MVDRITPFLLFALDFSLLKDMLETYCHCNR